METQVPVFDNEDLSWLDLDPLLEVLPSGPKESSWAQNITSIKNDDDDDDGDDEDD